ncbi:MAG: SEL1-like repeat protein [Gammaproteobacteria bacterium]|nr:SEL1-like repeat protein [Gammaproteobacteria bacterium]MBU1644751.1 SEL1-like repeat protein [Gammaproteobacteria bacterium]MBU1973485.1 SEL1-like repeat protein [Gammaproteobacteria bacterium]
MALMKGYLAEVLAAGSVSPAGLVLIRQGARLGQPRAMVQLGVMLGQGVGVERNPSAATRWFHQAAKAYDRDGQTLFGLALVTGFGIARDEKKGLQWLYRAAQDGQRPGLISALARRGASPDEMETLTDRQLTAFLVSFFEQRISDAHLDGVGNARTLETLQTLRDKVIAHPEAICLDDIPRSLYSEIDDLVSLARGFVSAVGFGYLSIAYEADDGHYFMAGDAKRSTTCLKRLLRTADVLPSS